MNGLPGSAGPGKPHPEKPPPNGNFNGPSNQPWTSWTETGLTWNNAPGLNRASFTGTGTLLLTQAVPLKPGPATFDLTAFVQANRGKVVTLQILDASTQNLYLAFNSKEATSSQPVLTLTY